MKQNLILIKLLLVFGCGVLLCYIFLGFHPVKKIFNEKGSVKNLMNLPEMEYINFEDTTRKIIASPSSCGHFPARENQNISDKYWQVTNTTNGTFYLFNSYYDDRETVNGSKVRILGMINKIHPTVKMYCQMWFFGMLEAISIEVYEYRVLWSKTWLPNLDGASPYLISCKNPLSSQGLIPSHVSLVEEKCGMANNVFDVINEKPKNGEKKLFLVCLRGLNFGDDISMLMIEWAEILKILGVDNVIVYVEEIHLNVMKVLEHYRKSGFFIIKFIKYPHELPNESIVQWIQNDLISYNDAFYENLYKYEFMIPMDVDEFIFLVRDEDRTWKDLITRTKARWINNHQIYDAYTAKCMYFVLKSSHENDTIEGIPKNFRFLSNIYRSTTFTAEYGGAKTFMPMDRVIAVHNHFPLICIDPERCNTVPIDTNDGHLSHYRSDCDTPECVASKSNPVKDTRLWKFKDEILENVNLTVEKIREEL